MLKILNTEKRNNMDKIDFRKANIEKLIESSSSEFGKEMYNNHISLMNRVYRKVNNNP